MSEWKEYKWGDIAELKYGKSLKDYHLKTTGIPVYGTNGQIGFTEKALCEKPSVIIGRKGAYRGVHYCKTSFFVIDTAFYLVPKIKELDILFSYYQLKTVDINAMDSGSAIPSTSREDFYEIDILLPPLPEQERIAEVLSSLDDKIDLLHRNNKTLEQLAETLFRQWFVEEAEEIWEEVKLGEYVNLVSGYSYRSVDLKSSTKALVTLKNFDRRGGFRHDGFKEYTGKYKEDQVVVSGDLIVAHTDITQEAEVLGNPAIVISTDKYESLIISTDLVKVVPTSYLTKVYLYFLMKTEEFKHYCLGASNGTTVLHLSKKALPEYDFKLPSAELVERFTVIAEPLLKKININQKHIQQLETLRDTLLPKLMSGVVRVKE